MEGEDDPKPRANFQRISACRGLSSQRLFTELRNTDSEITGKASPSLMDNPGPDISHWQELAKK